MASEHNTTPGLPHPQGRGEEPLYYFTCVYLSFLQGLFEQFEPGSYRWSEDESLSEIAITDQIPLPRDRIEKRPAIVTLRGPAQFANLSLDNMRNVDPITGTKTRTDLVPCTMSINCIAKVGLEAQRIGWIVMRFIRTFKTMIQRAGIHKVGDELSIGPESPPGSLIAPEAENEAVLVTVQSPFFFQWTETDMPLDAHKVQAIEARMQTALLPVAAQTTKRHEELMIALRSPTIRGRTLQLPDQQRTHLGGIIQTVKT